jgi:segregation and condensation protein B
MEELETLPQDSAPEEGQEQAGSAAQAAAAEPEQTAEQAQPEEPTGFVGQPQSEEEAESTPAPVISMEELLEAVAQDDAGPVSIHDAQLKAVLEAVIYVAEEPLTVAQMAGALQQTEERIQALLTELTAEWDRPEHGLAIREVAGGYKMATKPEHHDAVRNFVKSLKPPLKLSLPALETLAVIAYKQPVTAPEIRAVRGVHGDGVLKTLLERKLIQISGRKDVVGKPVLYKTTKEFLLQFGLKDLAELPSLKEFEEIRRMAFADADASLSPEPAPSAESDVPVEAQATAEVPAQAEPQAREASESPEPETAEEQSATAKS